MSFAIKSMIFVLVISPFLLAVQNKPCSMSTEDEQAIEKAVLDVEKRKIINIPKVDCIILLMLIFPPFGSNKSC